ncbi:uncharacterized protein A4U43_C07F6420 [Asparagus officinalis]|uniref:E3 ubiquitin-protein ligase listerin n=1 Tax=Asparagus officinalis TaxID=4686 RepID=A0A5P1ED65_ASPOF|nr:E3 ubiquitin-protein ligase listerin isoform X2 [Asparagus officinalis]ONK62651.1 uncharacterized protein A4U43_C07F6420 [Asparagus officinalis]
MGKQKGERSKNRPSSSSLAASLLPSGASGVGFGGYLGSSRIDPPTSSEESTSFSDVDSEVVQHLKRLGRKDPTTKLKALAALCLLFKQKSGEELAQIVPQWAFEYRRLLLDYNREVRRATHDAMTSLVTTVRKGLVPHLKSLMGPWWFSQFDPIFEVSQAAKRSLEAAFPASDRRLDALMLCINDIFLYLDENLKLTPQAMSDKASPMDELEDMHQRVISSSLLAVATLVDILLRMKSQSNDSEAAATEQKLASKATEVTLSSAEKILAAHNSFLEFLKCKSPVIRSATYSALTSFIKHIPQAFGDNMKAVSAAVLGVFQEKDASCHSSMWDMILLFSRKFPDCWASNNVQKVVLNRFWNFLRHGCYGSNQISYPALVVFLESIPPTAVGGEKFILDFFQNLWAGRNPLHSSDADRASFFRAFEECFLWAVQNASRYNTSQDAINPLSTKLVSNILVELLWRDYLLLVNLKSKDESQFLMSDGLASEGIQLSEEKSQEIVSASRPTGYTEELGKCIVGILADISIKESCLLTEFCTIFLKNCLDIFQQGEKQTKFPEYVERISNFFRLLDQYAWQKGQIWPSYLAGPLFANSFKITKAMDSPDAIRFLYILIEIFGPITLFSFLHFGNGDQWSIDTVQETNYEVKVKFFLQAFRDDFVPWCFHGHTRSCSEKIDLLIASIQDEFFSEQWCSVLTYATCTDPDKFTKPDIRPSDVTDQTELLAILIEKVKRKINKMKMKAVQNIGCLPVHWQHKLLDSAAISVLLHSPPSTSDARFLCAVLGGSTEDDRTCFVSGEVIVSVFQEILKNLVIFLSLSSFEWSRLSSSLLLSSRSLDLVQKSSSADRLKIAQFSFEVLEGSWTFCSKMLGADHVLLPSILAAIFIIDWECSMSSCLSKEDCSEGTENLINPDISLATDGMVLVDHSKELFDAKLMLGRRMHAFIHKISVSSLMLFSSSNISRLRSILVQTLRSAAFETNNLTSDRISSLCCEWMLDMLEVISHDETELQNMLDQLLTEDSSWTMWVAPSSRDENGTATIQVKREHTGIKEVRHNQFIAFVERLSSSLGFSKVIAGFVRQIPDSSSVPLTEHDSSFSSSYSRAWLAVELLCTWKWQGGSALDSFLPSLSKYAKYESPYPEVHVIFSIVNILFDGALVQGSNGLWISFNTWVPSDDEVENIKDPFLRAITSLLLILFVKDKTWRKHEALEIFKNVVGKLFTDATVNRTCLRILPFLLSILIEPLLLQSTEFNDASKDVVLAPWKDDSVLKSVLSWLQRALSFPPLGSGCSGEPDLEEWVQLIVSCYPLQAIGVPGGCKVELGRDIRHLEKSLMLSLFQKQRGGKDVSSSQSETPFAASASKNLVSSSYSQLILAKLTAVSVGYCWKEFTENDWHFVLDSLQSWIESSVLLMEEIAEKIDELVMSSTSKPNLDYVLEKLELAVLDMDPMAINISGTALLVLSLFSQLVELHETDSTEVLLTIKLGKWAQIKDRVMENILRLFFATGVAEAVASTCSNEASSIVASSRIAYSQFWSQVASLAITSSEDVRNTAAKSMELWGLSKGPISSLYAILFSSRPIPSLQFAAYRLISSEPLCHVSLLKDNSQLGNVTANEDLNLNGFNSSSVDCLSLMDEISFLIQKPASALLEMDLVSQDRVNVFLAWAILLSYLRSLSPSSSAREALTQYVRESVSSEILDCIFQNIPLKQGVGTTKKKDIEFVPEAAVAASFAKNVISSGSGLLNLETLWPIGTEQMASLAGSLYGMMIWLLPSYVSNWFSSLRDRSLLSAIESFTKRWCSPSLVSNELSQVKETVVADENFSVSVNKSAYEIIATYKKEETGMDLVIRLPICYPLRPVDVDCTRSLGISEVKKRKWLLSLTAFIRNQNGAIGEAVRIWKNNIDKEFRGVEECPICYSIIHTSNHSLPQLACKTCKHKFHSACLYKWFSTSHKSTCPLCQTPF